MSVVIYCIIKFISYPAAALKAFWEHLFLRIFKIQVEDVRYMQANELCGHVEHALISSPCKSFLFCFLPGLMNFIVALPIFVFSAANLFVLGVGPRDFSTGLIEPLFFVYVVLYYLSVSLLCNLFPLFEDAMHMWDTIYHSDNVGTALKAAAAIPGAIIYAGAFLERHAINALLAVAATCIFIFI